MTEHPYRAGFKDGLLVGAGLVMIIAALTLLIAHGVPQ